ncbi:MAG: MBL fold metallo-hydrolase [Planctomycetota bacterium]
MKLYSLLGNSQKLDGGAMYGNAPKALWSRYSPPDEQNRIDLACRCLLLEIPSRLILFETGIGTFFPPEMKERYGVQESEHCLLDSIKKTGFSPADITDIVLSHLHFDHAGGLLTAYEAGKSPQLLFPNARFYVGQSALERAKKPHFRDRASFIPELPTLLESSQRLEIIHHSHQHSLAPFVVFRFSEGHTPGLLLSEVQGARANVIFVSDLIPGSPWVHVPLTMGYDRFPEKLIEEKQSLLEECLQKGTYLFFTHDPLYAMSRIQKDEKGKFSVKSPLSELQKWEL